MRYGISCSIYVNLTNHSIDEPSLRCHQPRQRYVFCFVSAPMIPYRDSVVDLNLVALKTDTFTAVGVQGDARVYGYIAILRAVKTLDFMSAEVRTACLLGLKFLALTSSQPYEFDFGLLKKISTRIVNEVNGIARVTYDITSKPPGQSTLPPFGPIGPNKDTPHEHISDRVVIGTIEME